MTQKKLKEKRLKIVDETIATYTSKNRSINENGNCKYFKEGTPGCAVGRLIEDKDLCKRLDNEPSTSLYSIFDRIPDELKELGENFLGDLQALHDMGNNWDENGITQLGIENANRIKENHCK